ncbi:MAG: hypothetical protein A2X94_00190 [Bdellovibrionales bacterium GWB1_55_8]|nr:MAG: hypothetical protein A2X94_00190 [Bdellovibrionales bacterium GWB1_55_8]
MFKKILSKFSHKSFLKRGYKERRAHGGQASRLPHQDNAKLSDPGPGEGPLGASNEMPEGGDSTRSPKAA